MLSRLIATNRTKGVNLPRVEDDELQIITTAELSRLVESIDVEYRSMVEVLAWGALRVGEAAALRWDRVNIDTGMIEVVATTGEVRGNVVTGPPKTRAGSRSVPLPRTIIEHLDQLERHPSGQVWPSPNGEILRVHNWRRRIFNPAREQVGIELTPHHLRHFGISQWIGAGASVVQVARWAGHSTTSVLNVYGHLIHDQAEPIMAQLDASMRIGEQVW